MNSKTFWFLGLVFVFLSIWVVPAAETSQVIQFSGCDPSLVDTKAADLRFRIFTASSEGTLVFEETQLNVAIDAASGCISPPARIGDATAGGIPAALFTNPSLWVAFAAESDPTTELGSGRIPITAAGYAFRAANADNAATARTFTPGAFVSASVPGPVLTLRNTTGDGLVATAAGVGVYAATTAGGVGVDGRAESRGSDQTFGVTGTSFLTRGRGVAGFADADSGVTYGVWGLSASFDGAGGFFTNSRGDLIRASTSPVLPPVFRVANNGDVFVRGERIGQQGPPGAPVHTSAVCQTGTTVTSCGSICRNRVIAERILRSSEQATCTVTSDTGSCSATSCSRVGCGPQDAVCCVCSP